jgi:hypothetical protein
MPVLPLYKSPNAKRKLIVSESFNLDNGAGTTVDRVLMRHSKALQLYSARIVYDDATSGTVAAGSIQLGVAVGGATVIAATNYENAKAVGSTTSLTLLLTTVAADTPLCVRHTGVASTQAGQAHLELEYAVMDD